jgi:hypothetical protein
MDPTLSFSSGPQEGGQTLTAARRKTKTNPSQPPQSYNTTHNRKDNQTADTEAFGEGANPERRLLNHSIKDIAALCCVTVTSSLSGLHPVADVFVVVDQSPSP